MCASPVDQDIVNLCKWTNEACKATSYVPDMMYTCAEFMWKMYGWAKGVYANTSIPNQHQHCIDDPTYGKAYDTIVSPYFNMLSALYDIDYKVKNDPISLPVSFLDFWMDNHYGDYADWVRGVYPIDTTKGSCASSADGAQFVKAMLGTLIQWGLYVNYKGKTMCQMHVPLQKTVPSAPPILDCMDCAPGGYKPPSLPCNPE